PIRGRSRGAATNSRSATPAARLCASAAYSEPPFQPAPRRGIAGASMSRLPPAAAQPFDAAQDLRDAPRTGGRQRPKDAATLILTRREADAWHVLMGRRAPGHVFMASKWVFPGGRIERADFTAASANELPRAAAARLQRELPPRRARALALAAARETFEETGLLLAEPAPPATVAG